MSSAQDRLSDWETVCAEEDKLIRARRRWLQEANLADGQAQDRRVGLALSGGGIRSATFSLGLLRSLSRAKLIHSIDYLSSVSGGGYAASYYCSLFVPLSRRGAQGGTTAREHDFATIARSLGADVFDSYRGRQALSQLRQGGHYLAPNGTSDALFAVVVAVRNWLAVALVTGLATLGGFLLLELTMGLAAGWIVKLPGGLGLRDFPANAETPWAMVLCTLAVWPAVCAWSYWFARSGQVPLARHWRLLSIPSFTVVTIVALGWMWPDKEGTWPDYLRFWIPLVAAGALFIYAIAEFIEFVDDRRTQAPPATDHTQALAQEDRVRQRLGEWLLKGVLVFISAITIAKIDLFVDVLFSKPSSGDADQARPDIFSLPMETMLILAAAGITGVLLVRVLLGVTGGSSQRGKKKKNLIPWSIIRLAALMLGFTLLLILVLFWASVARAASVYLLPPGAGSAPIFPLVWNALPNAIAPFMNLAILTAIVIGAVFLIGQVDPLLNRSSLAAFYSGRLRAAYLGATNSRRWRMPTDTTSSRMGIGRDVDRADPFDEIHLDAYYDHSVMAPIHLINVTINETTSRSSRIIQRDRKGKSMTVAPSGYLYPPHSPSEELALLRRNEAEDLPLSSWIGISGAAFTTGAGHHTSLGTAMLAALTNMRLGYWWEHQPPNRRWYFRPSKLVQGYLLNELRANYDGTCADRWYLSDGGHYENTGVYELVRRRVPFIIASDNGADPCYEFSDVVSLIRKLRIDLDAEVEFLDESELSRIFGKTPWAEVFGTLDDIRGQGVKAGAAQTPTDNQPKAGPYATLARIRYPTEQGIPVSPSTLLLIKPRIAGRELPDLLQYREENAAFPQTPTTNQFFDEAQWESYYRLGQLIGDVIFDKDRFPGSRAPTWHPWMLQPLP